MHLPERQMRRCSSHRPWVDDNLCHLIRRYQGAWCGGDKILYNPRKWMQRRYYKRKIYALEEDNPKRGWKNILYVASVDGNCNNLYGLANSHCVRKLEILADNVCDFLQSVTNDFLQSVTNDFIPLSPDDSCNSRNLRPRYLHHYRRRSSLFSIMD